MQLHTQYTRETRGSYGNAATMRVHLSMTRHLKYREHLITPKVFMQNKISTVRLPNLLIGRV
jgi:hypothetical protein